MPVTITPNRQRVPLIDAATLEGRTRPLTDASVRSRVRFFAMTRWSRASERTPSAASLPTRARLGRH